MATLKNAWRCWPSPLLTLTDQETCVHHHHAHQHSMIISTHTVGGFFSIKSGASATHAPTCLPPPLSAGKEDSLAHRRAMGV